MPKLRQEIYTEAYLQGQEAAATQLANKGMGFPQTAKDCPAQERREFFQGYHAGLKEGQAEAR